MALKFTRLASFYRAYIHQKNTNPTTGGHQIGKTKRLRIYTINIIYVIFAYKY